MDPSTDAHGTVRSSVQGGVSLPLQPFVNTPPRMMRTCGVSGVHIGKFQDLFRPSGMIPAHITLARTCLFLFFFWAPSSLLSLAGRDSPQVVVANLLCLWNQLTRASPVAALKSCSSSPLSSSWLLTVWRWRARLSRNLCAFLPSGLWTGFWIGFRDHGP